MSKIINFIGDLALLLVCKTMQTGVPIAAVLTYDSLNH